MIQSGILFERSLILYLVCEIMEDITGHVTFIVIPTVSHEKSVENESFNVRTLYDYNPDADEYIPCKELGLFFKKGEILKIHRYVTWMTKVIIRVRHVKNQSRVVDLKTVFSAPFDPLNRLGLEWNFINYV